MRGHTKSDPAQAALNIIRALNGRWYGTYGTCPCPAHDDKHPSLSVRAGETTVLLKCHAGCQADDVIRALRNRNLWLISKGNKTPNPYPARPPLSTDTTSTAVRRLWDQALPTRGTLAERYLSNRYFTHIKSPELRFLPAAKHGPSKRELPCLVSAVRDHKGALKGLHRTFLNPNSADKADLTDCRLWLGHCRSNAIHLGQPTGGLLGIAEGLETADSASTLYVMPVWAAMSATNLSILNLPDIVKRVVIFADNDVAGQTAAAVAARNYGAQGRDCQVISPPACFNDFNDVMRAKMRGNLSSNTYTAAF